MLITILHTHLTIMQLCKYGATGATSDRRMGDEGARAVYWERKRLKTGAEALYRMVMVPYAPESRPTMEAKSRMASYSKFCLRESKTPESHLKASIAYSATQQWILSGGFLGFSIYVKKNLL